MPKKRPGLPIDPDAPAGEGAPTTGRRSRAPKPPSLDITPEIEEEIAVTAERAGRDVSVVRAACSAWIVNGLANSISQIYLDSVDAEVEALRKKLGEPV